ncbi:unnamed protein product [Rotaria sp. Silwood1]|nr:unnamed protein product [Rotaria sp. Silwood1]
MAIWLDETIEKEQNQRIQIREIQENVEKFRTSLSKHTIMVLLDNETQSTLRSFTNDINEILSKIFLRELRFIEACINADSFCQAEQGMDNFSCTVCELARICTSYSVTEKSKDLKKKLDDIVSTIANRYESLNIEDYPHHSPKDLLKKLETTELRGRPRYYEARMYVLRNIQPKFSSAIDNLYDTPSVERPAKIRSLNYLTCF